MHFEQKSDSGSPHGAKNKLLGNSHCEEEALLLSGTRVSVFATEVMHHHSVGIPGKSTEGEREEEDQYSGI